MTITASAPGKLMLLGEYAVLEGATALVAAVDRRATVRITPVEYDEIRVHAPDLGLDAVGHLAEGGHVQWDTDDAAAERLHLVTHVIEGALDAEDHGETPAATSNAGATPPGHENIVIIEKPDADRRPHGFSATLATTAFFDAHGAKLGLGSSAALTVALAGALRALIGRPRPDLPRLVAIHRAMQGGRGSGADIAASLLGGIVAYHGGNGPSPTGQPIAVPVGLPAGVRWCCVFTGRSTSTAESLAVLSAWRRDHLARYREHLDGLAAIAEAGVSAAHTADAGALLAAFEAYGARLDELGRAAELDIVGTEHREIRNAAARCGVIYKPSGAGGGDIGIGFAGDGDHIEAFRHAVGAIGYRIIDMAVEPQGLTISGS